MKNGKQTMTWTDAAGYRVTSSTSSKKYRPKKNKPLFTSSSRRSSSGSDDDYDYDDEYTNDPRNSLWHTHGKPYLFIGFIILIFWVFSRLH